MSRPSPHHESTPVLFDSGVFRSRFETPHGEALWTFVNEPECVFRMEALSDIGKPALRALEQPLMRTGLLATKAQVRETDRSDWERDKQMLGRMVKAVMESRGYELQPASLKFDGLIFSSGATYRRRPDNA
jgi:hypothetical protein